MTAAALLLLLFAGWSWSMLQLNRQLDQLHRRPSQFDRLA